MKTLITILIGCTFFLGACVEDTPSGGEPAIHYDFFRIVDASTNDDLFLDNSNYHLEDVKLFTLNMSDEWVDMEISFTEMNEHIVFGPVEFVGTRELKYKLYKLELTNDTDTIQVVATGDGNYDDIHEFYYNEALSDQYNFADEEFLNSYIKTNAAYSRGKLRDLPDQHTYIITFEKEIKK